MPNRSYQLINPVIEGTFQDVYEAKNPITAADNMWVNLTEHIVSHVPRFMFTMKDISSGRHYNFEVREDANNGSYTINKLNNLKINKKDFEDLTNNVDKYSKICEQKGGEKKRTRYEKSSSSSDSSSCHPYPSLVKTSPIALFHYNPYIYYKPKSSILNPELVAITTPIFTPVFRPTLGTFIGIWP
jgi:hypothetical protein